MSESRLPDYLDHIQQAAADARSFVEVVWETVQEWLPELLMQLAAVRRDI